MTADDAPDRDLEGMSLEEIADAVRDGELTLEDLRANEVVRNRINRAIIRQDMAEHSEVYERLAEV